MRRKKTTQRNENMKCQTSDPSGAEVVKTANYLLEKIDRNWKFAKSSREAAIPCFCQEDIALDKLIAEGGFSSVYGIKKINVDLKNKKECYPIEQESRRKKIVDNPKDFVIKFLGEKAINDTYEVCCLDLVTETKILANLSHPHIISLRGVSSYGILGLKSRCQYNFFLILDKLDCTLRERQKQWNKKKGAGAAVPFGDRLKVAIEVADAMCYLSRKRILHRDIKPDNVGFTKKGDAKLYDFGLAKILPREGQDFKFTAMVGTLRYMSPECAKKEKYGLASDVYSFSLLLWELLSFDFPYRGMKDPEIHKKLTSEGCPLQVIESWPAAIKNCVLKGSDYTASKRPSIESMYSNLSRRSRKVNRRASLPTNGTQQCSKIVPCGLEEKMQCTSLD